MRGTEGAKLQEGGEDGSPSFAEKLPDVLAKGSKSLTKSPPNSPTKSCVCGTTPLA